MGVNNKYLQMGFPVVHKVESDYLTELWRITDCEDNLFRNCQMYSQLESIADLNSIYTYIEFNGFTEIKDVINNCYLISQLLVMDMQYLGFNEKIGAALACNDSEALKKLILYTTAHLPESCKFKIIDLQIRELCCL